MAISLEQIRRAADRVAVSHRLEVVEIEYLGGSGHRILRIFIEKNREERVRLAAAAQAGLESQAAQTASGATVPAESAEPPAALDQPAWVTHEDCEIFSRDLSTLLDVEDLVPGADYVLEVSSPGLDRGLSSPADFERFRSNLVKVRTFEPIAGNRHWQGRLAEVTASGIVLQVAAGGKKSGKKGMAAERREIGFSNIEKANLVPEF
ncbi:MAG TPA: ribosome maturation factor RimP [Acidobacteriaceae bacterium]|jgi:ribosome maturation factor RimP|nr:ribosome maturation factor RimP [Acidobacteriaceae bacterium]